MQDNCGTFDTLIPLLPENVSFLAIDLPGHGLSSRLPPGIPYHNITNNVILVRTIQKYFGWKRLSLMGHSLGAILLYIFSVTYPAEVEFLVCFDFLKPLHKTNIIEERAKLFDDFLKYNQYLQNESPSYTMDELKQLYHVGSWKSVDLDHCSYILERNTTPSKNYPGKYHITRDPRVKIETFINFPRDEVLEGAKRLSMPVFVSRGTVNPIEEDDKQQHFYEVLEVVKKASVDCRFYLVNGTHHHHLNTPETIAGLLGDFLKCYYVGEPCGDKFLRSNL